MLTNKVAIVTGASRGIGSSIAKKLSILGAHVIINYCGSEEEAKKVRDEILDNNYKGEIYQCDVSDMESCREFVDNVYKKYGRIDILVNNAGITRDNLLIGMSEDEFDSVINTNLKGTFNY